VRVIHAPRQPDGLAALWYGSTWQGEPSSPLHPLVPRIAANGTRRRFHTSGGAPVTANDNVSPVPRRSGSQKRQRNLKIGVACDPTEFVVIDDKARTAGLSRGSFLRTCALGSPGPRARRSPPINAEVLAHAVAALNKVGSNLNQLVRILNSSGAIGIATQSFAALADTQAAVTRILEIVRRKDRA